MPSSSSSFDLSGLESGEEEMRKPVRKSMRNTPQKSKGRRRSARLPNYNDTIASSDENEDKDDGPIVKRRRASQRSRDKSPEAPEAHSPVRDEEEKEPALPAGESPDRSPKKVAFSAAGEDNDGASSNVAKSRASKGESTQKLRKSIAKASSTGSQSPTGKVNGVSRATPKHSLSKSVDEEDVVRALTHALKTNTAMMGDLAAELRLLRESVVLQNRRS